MPIYEYLCSECGVQFERWQRIGDGLPDTCPNGHAAVRRLLSQPAIIFKGSGFYVTDHGRNGRSATSAKPEHKHKAEPVESTEGGTKPSGVPTEKTTSKTE